MRRPGPLVFLFGNPLSAFALLCAACYCGYAWWTGQMQTLPALVVVLAACYAFRASDQYRSYRDWKREWDAMEGRVPSQRLARVFRRGGPLHIIAALCAWAVCAVLILAKQDQPFWRLPVATFWLATALMIVVAIYRAVKRSRARRAPKIEDVPVTVCLRVPRRSPAAEKSFAMLPAYCVALIPGRAKSSAP
jgi:hypothetical protein